MPMEKQLASDNLDLDRFVCPSCHHKLSIVDETLRCLNCPEEYSIIAGIPDFRERDEYWCNVRRETMHNLNTKAKESGDWLTAAKEYIPQYLGHVESFIRADAQFLWPINSGSRILDAGSMWGGLTVPVAQYCDDVVAVDMTRETLDFLRIRAGQMGLNNIKVVAASVHKLPFEDNYFDMVILNGVLEWVAFERELVHEIQYKKKRTDTVIHRESPKTIQLRVLREIRRVLKPDGFLHLAIENRFGYQYFVGQPEEHIGLRYISLMPRPVANMIARKKLNQEYRMHTYSAMGYRSLLRQSGFEEAHIYGAFDQYRIPRYLIPLDRVKNWKNQVLPISHPRAPLYARLAGMMFPRKFLQYLVPGVVAIAGTEEGMRKAKSRVAQLLAQAGLFNDEQSLNLELVKFGGRSENHHTANFFIYQGQAENPSYFCKICRTNDYLDILEHEYNNLNIVNKLLTDTELEGRIPKVLFHGTIDRITFLVTHFLEGHLSGFQPNNSLSTSNLKKLDESIRYAIEFLVQFQRCTHVKNVVASEYLIALVEKQEGQLKNSGKLTSSVNSSIQKLKEDILRLGNIEIPICGVHGDYDLYHNLLYDGNRMNGLIDFEHFESEGLPFSDLASLVFHPFLMKYRNSGKNESFNDFADRNELSNYIREWLNLYADLSGISNAVLRHCAQLAALERQTREYTHFRDPNSIPMYWDESFNAMIGFKADV